jgi:hypothetical protein
MPMPDHSANEAAADGEEEQGRADRRAAPDPQARERQRQPGGEHHQHRPEDHAELRHAEVELGLEGRHAEQQPARESDRAHGGDPGALAALHAGRLHRALALGVEHGDAQQRHRGAADQHQMGRTPERHVLAEQPVPDVVEREPDQREDPARADQHAAERRVPVA